MLPHLPYFELHLPQFRGHSTVFKRVDPLKSVEYLFQIDSQIICQLNYAPNNGEFTITAQFSYLQYSFNVKLQFFMPSSQLTLYLFKTLLILHKYSLKKLPWVDSNIYWPHSWKTQKEMTKGSKPKFCKRVYYHCNWFFHFHIIFFASLSFILWCNTNLNLNALSHELCRSSLMLFNNTYILKSFMKYRVILVLFSLGKLTGGFLQFPYNLKYKINYKNLEMCALCMY